MTPSSPPVSPLPPCTCHTKVRMRPPEERITMAALALFSFGTALLCASAAAASVAPGTMFVASIALLALSATFTSHSLPRTTIRYRCYKHRVDFFPVLSTITWTWPTLPRVRSYRVRRRRVPHLRHNPIAARARHCDRGIRTTGAHRPTVVRKELPRSHHVRTAGAHRPKVNS